MLCFRTDQHVAACFEQAVHTFGLVALNNRDILINFARQGLGLAYVAQYEVERELAESSLMPVLSEFIPKTSGLYLYFPARTQAQLKLRAFIDMVSKVRAC